MNRYTPTEWVDGVTPVDEKHLNNTETQYLKVAGVQTLDELPAVPDGGHNVCIVKGILYQWDGSRWGAILHTVSSMPSPSADLTGQVVLYMGAEGQYSPGFFYKCDGTSWTAFSNSSIEWGEIKGTLADQTDLAKMFADYVPANIGTPAWDSSVQYNAGSTVIRNLKFYISQANFNTNHDPMEEGTEWWALIEGSGSSERGGGRVVSRIIGDGVNNSFTIIHGFGTKDFFFSIRAMEEPYSYSLAQVEAIDNTSCRVIFNSPPALNELRVILSDGSGSLGTTTFVYEQTTAETVWTIQHDLNKYVQVEVTDTAGTTIVGQVIRTSPNLCRIEFNVPVRGYAIVE